MSNNKLLKLAEEHPELKELIQDVSLIASYIKIDLENNGLNEEVCAINDYKNFSEKYYNIDWICTDPDKKQYGKKLYEGHYSFIEYNPAYELNKDEDKWIMLDIFLKAYDDKTINNHISAYYDSLEHLKEVNGDDWEWIVAECIFEQESGLY